MIKNEQIGALRLLKRMALLFSHTLTEEQKREAREKWEIGTFLSLPGELKSRWSQVPPEGPFPREWLQPVLEWLIQETEAGDVVLVQGEFGAVYRVVSWCHGKDRIPVYSTTVRRYESLQQPDGSVKNVHLFKHVNFRRYPRG